MGRQSEWGVMGRRIVADRRRSGSPDGVTVPLQRAGLLAPEAPIGRFAPANQGAVRHRGHTGARADVSSCPYLGQARWEALVPIHSNHEAPAADRLALLLATFGAAARAIAGAADRDSLAAAIANVLVSHGAYTIAWVGADLDGAGLVEPIAVSGDPGGYLDGALEGGGLPRAFPLHSEHLPSGVLNVYSPSAGAFGELERDALTDLARAVGLAFGNFAAQTQRVADAAELHDVEERQFDIVVTRLEHLEAVSRVAATAAHDFGNVLMAISLLQGFMAESVAPEDPLASDIAAIGHEVERARVLSSHLLAVGRVSPKEVTGPVDAAEALDGLLGILETIAAPSAVRRGLDQGPGGDPGAAARPVVQIGRRELEHAVLNLVINARDAMASRAGVITVTVDVERVPAGSDVGVPAGSYVTVTVVDTGPGMAQEVLDRAFEPFYTTKPHGTGLGLPSVMRTVRRAGGTVRISSAPGAGTTVTLLLPEVAG